MYLISCASCSTFIFFTFFPIPSSLYQFWEIFSINRGNKLFRHIFYFCTQLSNYHKQFSCFLFILQRCKKSSVSILDTRKRGIVMSAEFEPNLTPESETSPKPKGKGCLPIGFSVLFFILMLGCGRYRYPIIAFLIYLFVLFSFFPCQHFPHFGSE